MYDERVGGPNPYEESGICARPYALALMQGISTSTQFESGVVK